MLIMKIKLNNKKTIKTAINKVLLITSRSISNSIQDSLAIPYGLYLLKNHLNKNGAIYDVFDLGFKPESECLDKIKQGNYNIIGISVTHWNMVSDLDFLYTIKKIVNSAKKNTLLLAGGFSATLNYKEWLNCGFDLICVGYAEDTLLKICENYSSEKNKEELISFFGTLSGAAFKNLSGKAVFNHSKPLSKEDFEYKMFTSAMNIDIPYMEYWDYMNKRATGILSINKRSYVIENARLYTSSRCLANCGYCCCPAFLSVAQKTFANLYMLSAKQIYELVVYHVKKYGAKSFSLNDEDFLIGSKSGINRVMEFCDLIIQSKKNGEISEDIKFSCQTRASDFLIKDTNQKKIVNFPLIKKMTDAKFHNVSLGIETFSETMIKLPSINKPYACIEDYHHVLEAMMEVGLYPTINLILGIPEETPEGLISTIEQTIKYIDKPCQVSAATKMLSFPGAPIWNSKDYPTENIIWENPITKEKVSIPIYYKPQNKKIADLIESLEENKLSEIESLKLKYGLEKSQFVPRIAISLCTFKIIVKSLGYDELSIKISNKLEELINQSLNIQK